MVNKDSGQQDRPVTIEDIKKFYQDVVAGLWNGRELEADKEERRLLRAFGIGLKRKNDGSV